jgi:hypothetical protein
MLVQTESDPETVNRLGILPPPDSLMHPHNAFNRKTRRPAHLLQRGSDTLAQHWTFAANRNPRRLRLLSCLGLFACTVRLAARHDARSICSCILHVEREIWGGFSGNAREHSRVLDRYHSQAACKAGR